MSDSRLLQALARIEHLGNRLPPPTWLFVWLCGLVLAASAVAAASGWQAVWPDGSRTVSAINLLSADGLRRILSETVSNFTQFAPVGTVLVAMLGLGLAERSGLLGAALARLVRLSGRRSLPAVVAFAGVMSSIAADAGYVVVIPLAGLLFQRAGLPPLAGIACAFAGVSGGFSANLLIGPVDALLAGIASEALRTLDADAHVAVTANYYFMAVSVVLVTGVVTLVHHTLILPYLQRQPAATQATVDGSPAHGETTAGSSAADALVPLHRGGLRAVGLWTLLVLAVIALTLLPADASLRGDDGSLIRSPWISGIVVLVAVWSGVAGILYARVSGLWTRSSDAVAALEDTLRSLASYLVLMFFAAQFVAYFQWSQIGQLIALDGALGLRELAWSPVALLLLFVLLTVALDLLIGSASAKWALMAPVFIPMFVLVGIPADATLAAYRVGDSVANIITPLMPYFAMVVAFAQRHQPSAGIGTLMALMLPYSLALLLGWGTLLGVWLAAGWPLGPVQGLAARDVTTHAPQQTQARHRDRIQPETLQFGTQRLQVTRRAQQANGLAYRPGQFTAIDIGQQHEQALHPAQGHAQVMQGIRFVCIGQTLHGRRERA